MIDQNDKAEFIGCIIDVFEDFLDEKNVTLEAPEESDKMELGGNIYGSDYDSISDSLGSLLQIWKVIE